jgi:hypothetical protein
MIARKSLTINRNIIYSKQEKTDEADADMSPLFSPWLTTVQMMEQAVWEANGFITRPMPTGLGRTFL